MAVQSHEPQAGSRFRLNQHSLAPLLARLCAARLDRQLAAGLEPWSTPVHAARARRLTRERARRTLARSLERLVEQAEEEPSRSFSNVVRPSRPRVREARPLLLTLASRLRGAAPVHPRGVAALKDLVTDGGGPIYMHGDPDALKIYLETIELWMDAHL